MVGIRPLLDRYIESSVYLYNLYFNTELLPNYA